MVEKQHFTASDGARIAFSDQGQGLPLLCLSGLTRNGADFDYMLPYLPRGWRVIRMDYRGRGDSDYTGAQTYTVPREALDAVELLDHLGLKRAALLGTSRGGMVGMFLAATQKDRLAGLCLNDVGPELNASGLDRINTYLGRSPRSRSLEDYAQVLAANSPGMDNVPPSRWQQEAERHAIPTPEGRLTIPYDPALREAFLAATAEGPIDLWPLFDACQGLPLGLLRGANSDLLSLETVAQMRSRRPDMLYTQVPDRAHIPFLDEPASVTLLAEWLAVVEDSGRLG